MRVCSWGGRRVVGVDDDLGAEGLYEALCVRKLCTEVSVCLVCLVCSGDSSLEGGLEL